MKGATSKQQRAHELLMEINRLCHELDDLILLPDVQERSPSSPLGCQVRICVGAHRGKCGTVVRPRGTEFFYIRLDDGQEVYKKPHNFTILSRPPDGSSDDSY